MVQSVLEYVLESIRIRVMHVKVMANTSMKRRRGQPADYSRA